MASYSVSGEALAECCDGEGTAATTTEGAIDRRRRVDIFAGVLESEHGAATPLVPVRHEGRKAVALCIVIKGEERT